jgi:hypothetical protein
VGWCRSCWRLYRRKLDRRNKGIGCQMIDRRMRCRLGPTHHPPYRSATHHIDRPPTISIGHPPYRSATHHIDRPPTISIGHPPYRSATISKMMRCPSGQHILRWHIIYPFLVSCAGSLRWLPTWQIALPRGPLVWEYTHCSKRKWRMWLMLLTLRFERLGRRHDRLWLD